MLTADTFVCLLKRRYKTQVCGLLLCVCIQFCVVFLGFFNVLLSVAERIFNRIVLIEG